MKKKILMLLTLPLATVTASFSQAWGYDNNRIAISADGNNADDIKDKWLRADPDDWGATPAAMAILAKLQVGDKLVHFSYNNFVEGNDGPDDENVMNIGVQSGLQRLRLNPDVFFDVTKVFDEAKASLVKELAKSSASDPLYFIHMGPSEFFYQCVKECVDQGNGDALAHVYVVSHSGYNDNHLRRTYHHTMEQAIEYSGGKIQYKRIKDQNGSWSPDVLWNSEKDFSVWYWMRDSKDPNIQWLYERLQQHSGGVADISDAGLLYYLLLGDEDGSPSKFKEFLGDEIVPNSIVHPTAVVPESDDMLVFVGQRNVIKVSVEPELTSNKSLKWESSNPEIARVMDGVIYGVKTGKANITVATVDGGVESVVVVSVEDLKMPNDKVVLSAIDDFETIEVDGFVPAYKDMARKAIAIDASRYQDKYAAANTVFEGETGLYDITLTTMRELDGESKYRVKIGGCLVGEYRNSRTETDYELSFFTIRKVTIRKGDLIQIESNSSSNFRVPEGDAYAFARGRWARIGFTPADLNIEMDASEKVIVIEAENAKYSAPWSVEKDAVASSGAYLVYGGENQYAEPIMDKLVEFTFQVDDPGIYTVKWLMRQPDGQRGSDLGNDVWINFTDAQQKGGNEVIEGYHKFVSRSNDDFCYGGQLDIHTGQPWMHVNFEKAGKYTLMLSGRSAGLQIDKIILFKGVASDVLQSRLK